MKNKKTTTKKDKEQEHALKQEQEDINDLSDKRMLSLLVELTDTAYWKAIQKYIRSRDMTIISTFYSIDPFKEPTQMARAQGIRIGLYDMESAIIQEKNNREKNANKDVLTE